MSVDQGVPAQRRRREGDEYVGRSVVDGQLRHASVSQIVIFDPHYEGGCPRRWYYVYPLQMKEEQTVRQSDGVDRAALLEQYLKTGDNVLDPVLRAAKHLFPKPGPDLEVERSLATDKKRAVALRDRLLAARRSGEVIDVEQMRRELWDAAGLVAADVPLFGAADFRHRRGEYVDGEGVLRREAPGHVVCETGDLKTTSRIHDHVVQRGKTKGEVRYGNAKPIEEILVHPQMLGYGRYAARRFPDTTHQRLSHVYAQTDNGRIGHKRTGLLESGEVVHRWETIVEPVVREMEEAARQSKPEDVPGNRFSCIAFRKPCPHESYCQKPPVTLVQAFLIAPDPDSPRRGLRQLGDPMSTTPTGSNGLYASLCAQGSPAPVVPPALPPGAATQMVERLFGPPPLPATAPPAIPSVQAVSPAPARPAGAAILAESCVAGAPYYVLTDAGYVLCTYQGPTTGMPPIRHIFDAVPGPVNAGKPPGVVAEAGREVIDPRQIAPAVPPQPAPPVIPPQLLASTVNPPDSAVPDLLLDADPLTPEQIAAILDPEIRAKAEAHAKAHAEKKAREDEAKAAEKRKKREAAKEGECGHGRRRVRLTSEEAQKREKVCQCGKALSIRPSQDKSEATLSKHAKGPSPISDDWADLIAKEKDSTGTIGLAQGGEGASEEERARLAFLAFLARFEAEYDCDEVPQAGQAVAVAAADGQTEGYLRVIEGQGSSSAPPQITEGQREHLKEIDPESPTLLLELLVDIARTLGVEPGTAGWFEKIRRAVAIRNGVYLALEAREKAEAEAHRLLAVARE